MIDDAQFERLVRDTQDKALRLAHAFLGDWDEARDAVQDAFVKAYRHRRAFQARSAPGTWFFRILSNHCRDRLRRRKVRAWLFRHPGAGDGDPGDAAADHGPGPDRRAADRAFCRDLAVALGRLPARQREVFRLKAVAGLTLAETAETLGISVGATKAHLFRATRALQGALTAWKDEP